MRLMKNDYLYLAVSFVIGLLFYIYLFNFTEIVRDSIYVILSFITNTLLSIYFLFTLEKRDYSFNKIFWVFNLSFLSILPLAQYGFDVRPWYELQDNYDDDMYLYTNILIFLWFISYFTGYKSRVKYHKSNFKQSIQTNLNLFGVMSIYALTVLLIFLYYLVAKSIAEDTAQSIILLVMTIIKGMTVFGLLILINHYRSSNNMLLLIFLLLLLSLYFLFSVEFGGGGRHYLAVVLFGLFFSYFRMLGNQLYFIVMLMAALVMFPFIGQIRGEKSIKDVNFNVDILSMVASGDFDAYTMFINIIHYVDNYSYEYGMQILGALLFFIPRQLWPDKPIGTGAHVAEAFKYYFTNVSAPLVSEAYINYGVLGIILFGYLLGRLLRKLDLMYWDDVVANRSGYLYLIYPFAMVYFFFMLRGDFLSSYAYIFGFIVSTYLLYFIIKKIFTKPQWRKDI